MIQSQKQSHWQYRSLMSIQVLIGVPCQQGGAPLRAGRASLTPPTCNRARHALHGYAAPVYTFVQWHYTYVQRRYVMTLYVLELYRGSGSQSAGLAVAASRLPRARARASLAAAGAAGNAGSVGRTMAMAMPCHKKYY